MLQKNDFAYPLLLLLQAVIALLALAQSDPSLAQFLRDDIGHAAQHVPQVAHTQVAALNAPQMIPQPLPSTRIQASQGPQPQPAPQPPNPSTTSSTAAVIGAVQAVFTYHSQKCDDIDIPDTPARAFRDASGRVVLIASHYVNRRAVGSTLESVVHQCPIIYNSHNDTVQAGYRYHEWLMAPYTLDGINVYAIVHNEWYGSLTGQQCDPGADWINGFTLAVSHDGGATFAQPSAYLVRYPITAWRSSFACTNANSARYGDYNGTNIVSMGGLYYRIFDYVAEPGANNVGQSYQCLMRTDNLADASSWEVWTGSGYARSATAPCAPLSRLGSGWPSTAYSLSYNTHLHAYVALIDNVSGTFYFQTSPDLLTWSGPAAITGTPPGRISYPSLLDPDDTSRNFENSGQTPYLYFTRFNNGSGLDRDLLRVQITFNGSSTSPAPGP